MNHQIKIAIGTALLAGLSGVGCGGGGDADGPLSNIDSLVILQRKPRVDQGDIFQYTSYVPGARLVKLQPPTADGKLTTICCDQAGDEYKNIDIQGYDIAFDAKSIVFAGKLSDNENYGLFLLQLADGKVTQVATDPQRDFVSPIFLPGDRIMFTSNAVVEANAPQHKDEYERGVSIQLGRVNLDGSGLEYGPRNLSHRTAPSLASDGRVVFTQWDHLGQMNQGDLMFVNQDMQELREAFGKEGTGASNSTLKAREISPGRFIAIATARNRTINAGALIDIRLGKVSSADGDVTAATDQSEKNASYQQLTPDVPTDNQPSSNTVGRYYDAFPLNAKDKPDLLVSWANGPVESSVLAQGNVQANFGIYLYDSAHQQRRPILDDPNMWDVFAQPLQTRPVPPIVSSAQDPNLAGSTLIGSLNVYNSTLHSFNPGEIYGVRVMEGFSSEEGFPTMFGNTMFEGHANLGVAPVNASDGSWAAKIPPNIPIHVQAVDKFGMSIFNEPVWFSGRPGESRICGGCHEDRARATTIPPGVTDALAVGATNLMSTTARNDRKNTAPGTDAKKIVGVGWDQLVQPIFDKHCTSCHNGQKGTANPTYTITSADGKTNLEWTFNLSGDPMPAGFAVIDGGGAFSSSYFSMAGPDMEAVEKGKLMLSGEFMAYMNPVDARNSDAIKRLNPMQVFPTEDAGIRAFATKPHLADKTANDELTPSEMYTLILAADMGLNWYARENKPAAP